MAEERGRDPKNRLRPTKDQKMMIWNAEKGKCAGSRVEFNALQKSGNRNS